MNSTLMSETTTVKTAANTTNMREYTETMENTPEELNMETGGQPQMEQNGATVSDDESGMWDMFDDMMSPPPRGRGRGPGCHMGPRGKPFIGRGGGRGRGFRMGPPRARMHVGPHRPHDMGFDNGFGPGFNQQGPGFAFAMGPPWSGPMGFWNHPHAASFAHGPWQAWNQGHPNFIPGTSGGPQAHGPLGIPPRLLRRMRRLATQMEDETRSSDSETENPREENEGKDKGNGSEESPSGDCKANKGHPVKGMKGPRGLGPKGPRCGPRVAMDGPLGWSCRPHGSPVHGCPALPPRLIHRLRRLMAQMEQEGQQDSKDNTTEKKQGQEDKTSTDQRQARRQAFVRRLNAWLDPANENEATHPRPGRGMRCGPPDMQRRRFLHRLQRLAAQMEDSSSSSESEDDIQKTADATTEQKMTTEQGGVGKPQNVEANKEANLDERRRAKRKARMAHLMGGMHGWSDPVVVCHGPPQMDCGPMGMGPRHKRGMCCAPMGMGPGHRRGMGCAPMGMRPGHKKGMRAGWFGYPHGPPSMQGRPVIPPPLVQRLRRLVRAMENEGHQEANDNSDKTDTTQNDERQVQRHARRVARLQRLLESLDSDSEGHVPRPRHWRRMAAQGPQGPGPHLPLRRLLKKILKSLEQKVQLPQGDTEQCDISAQEEDHMAANSGLMNDCTDLCEDIETIDLGQEVEASPESEPKTCPTCSRPRTT